MNQSYTSLKSESLMKTILITGSNSDIGIAVAKALIEHPVKLVLRYYFRRKNVKIWPAKSPYGRPIHPDEIGKTVKWLVFESPETMTGSLVTVSGGWEY
jgi:NAD(P)-dependent dehydrogenase (short-subunit alcohol dehydrogenase family)